MQSKKFLATSIVAAAAAVAVATPSASAATSTFKDVSTNYQAAVDFLYTHAITRGYTPDQFGTTDSVKRADAAVLIANALGFDPNKAYKDAGFKDVPARSKWAVNALVEAKIIDGLNANEFGSDELLTRNQMAKVLANAGKLSIDNNVKSTQFKDVNSNFAKYVEALVKASVTQGKSDTNFGAYDNVTRGEIALFLYRAQESLGFIDLMVMHMNDHHAYLSTFPYVSTVVNELRSEHKNNVLLHAGDAFSGDLYFNAFHGAADVAMMNQLGFDAMTFGNHEFDLGSSAEGHLKLQEFVKAAKFPFVSANVDFSKDKLFDGLQTRNVSANYKDGQIYDGIVINVNGQKVGVFGLTTEETPTISSTGEVKFENYIERAKASVKAFEAQGVNKIIALTHIGFDDSLVWDNDQELAKQVAGIDIIVGGHTHSSIGEPVVVINGNSPTIIVQANEYGKVLGTLDVKFNPKGEIYSHAGKLITIDTKEMKADKKAADILAPFTEKVKEIKEESIGSKASVLLDGNRDTNNEGLSSVRHNETNLGNLITDAMLWKAKSINDKTTIAIQNGGGIRESIAEGDITTGDVLKVMPYGNALAIAELSGADLLATLEHGIGADVIDGGKGLKESGGFLHVSGMKFTYDSTKAKGERVQSVQILEGDKYVDLDKTKTYFIATNVFTAKGGDGFTHLGNAYKAGKVSEPGFVDYENFIEYVKTLEGDLTPEIEGRIIDVSLATQQNGYKTK
ncbi:5'-nucleotidase C-terminal domain-containing protein [Sporosarcina thermotolerans]|uniref:5'-nucleotidase C-terminal domain-containing protein n=1 Tax=Sporosarcina thermotolerans TaxID=633404 RepID=A0AAW9A9I0_9BACL|nr:5'-nucleotidase C-terminal domain-containing protein [Sporosarcina thermotolerans]MDW0116338.1 5'-nucleotidase C-terminal domain-containing protein [Sporosarcina thermotolerans]WHT49999.1 5'-nucleotidase C-terminal domain-containing protein [Sporosarcina thermotolerans]